MEVEHLLQIHQNDKVISHLPLGSAQHLRVYAKKVTLLRLLPNKQRSLEDDHTLQNVPAITTKILLLLYFFFSQHVSAPSAIFRWNKHQLSFRSAIKDN
jgi:hypothetical protein